MVEDTLADLGLRDKPRLLVVNKMDLLGEAESGEAAGAGVLTPAGLQDYPSVPISAAKGWNLDLLLEEIEAQLVEMDGPLTVLQSAAGGDRRELS